MSGFYNKNDQGTFQVDGRFRVMALDRVVNLTLNILGDGGEYYNILPNNPGEIVAIRAPLPVAVTGQTSTGLNISGPNPANGGSTNTQVECFVFSNNTNYQRGPAGLRVYNEVTGALAYDSSQMNMCPVAVVDGAGDFTYDSSRKYAAVVLNQYVVGVDTLQGTPPSLLRVINFTRGMVSNLSNGIKIQNRSYWGYATSYTETGGPFWPSYAINSPTNKHMIVDVTAFA